MPRNSSGVYTLPAGNPVVADTIIDVDWANPTMADIGNEITLSLPRNGSAGMTGPLTLIGNAVSPLQAVPLQQLQSTAGLYLPLTGGTLTGDLTFSGNGRRIKGDFSTATLANRLALQSSVVNGATVVMALPNGAAATGSYVATNAADPTNASYLAITANAADVSLNSGRFGTGAFLPFNLIIGGNTNLNVLTTGQWGLGTAAVAGANFADARGIGVGAAPGGTMLAQNITGQLQVNSATLYCYRSSVTTAPAVNVDTIYHFAAIGAAKGAGSAITNEFGFYAGNLDRGGSVNAGFSGAVAAGTNKYNCYMNGTAVNFFQGYTGVGAAPYSTVALNAETAVATHTAVFAKNVDAAARTLSVQNSATSGDNIFAGFATEATYTERGSIDYNRAGGVVRYNTSSDATLKNIIGDAPLQKSVNLLMKTRIREYSWKGDKTNKVQVGVIAQEVYESGFEGAVSVGGDRIVVVEDGTETTEYQPWGVDKTAWMFHLVAGVQYLMAENATLKARLDALEQQ